MIEYLDKKGLQCVADGGESMEVCFISGDYRDFLRDSVPDIDARFGAGSFVDSGGRVLGSHKGYPFYTIGQRKGLGVALGYPAYVIKINPAKGIIFLIRARSINGTAIFLPFSILSSRLLYHLRYKVCILKIF